MGDDHLRVFLSYSHENQEHRHRVLMLAESLRSDGFDAVIDQYVAGTPSEGWPRWMLKQIALADYVLLICTATYYRRDMGWAPADNIEPSKCKKRSVAFVKRQLIAFRWFVRMGLKYDELQEVLYRTNET
jgi:hypothetical protein